MVDPDPPAVASTVGDDRASASEMPTAATLTDPGVIAEPNADAAAVGVAVAVTDTPSFTLITPGAVARTVGETVAYPPAPTTAAMPIPPPSAVAFAVAVCVARASMLTDRLDAIVPSRWARIEPSALAVVRLPPRATAPTLRPNVLASADPVDPAVIVTSSAAASVAPVPA